MAEYPNGINLKVGPYVSDGTPERGALRTATIAVALLMLVASTASAQVNGFASVIVDALPDVAETGGAQPVVEMRVRLFAERRYELGPHVRINLAGYVDGLVADRSNVTSVGTPEGVPYDNPAEAGLHGNPAEAGLHGNPAEAGLHGNEAGLHGDAIVRPADLYLDVVASRFDLRVGAARIVWGRLDEFQPTDVVNPIDLSRFLLEGRSEARLPVGLVRARVFLPRSTTLEAVIVPHFRRGRFDQLEESSSPFNLALAAATALPTGTPIPRITDEPDFGSESLQGGVRLTTTTSRVDWSVSAYRGIRAFPVATVGADDANPAEAGLHIRESFPRFTMIGGDFETVQGAWGVRGEVAAFVDDGLQSTRTLQAVEGRSISAGIGVDRKAGDYRIAANAIWSRSTVDGGHTDTSLVIAADRSFARETRTLRLFAVYDPADATTFTRAIAAVSLRDNLWLEGSGGVFTGSSLDVIGQLTRRDFLYARLKVFF